MRAPIYKMIIDDRLDTTIMTKVDFSIALLDLELDSLTVLSSLLL